MLRFANENTQDKPRFVMGCGRGGKLDPRFDTGGKFDRLLDRWR
jgi:hypothetical protein